MKRTHTSWIWTFAVSFQASFIALKIAKIITWSWLWVMSPTWVMAILVILCLALVGLFTIISFGKIQ